MSKQAVAAESGEARTGRTVFLAGAVVRHKKSGGLYQIVAWARMEANQDEVVVYRGLAPANGVWVRSREEMFDGRFELVEPARQETIGDPGAVEDGEADSRPTLQQVIANRMQLIAEQVADLDALPKEPHA